MLLFKFKKRLLILELVILGITLNVYARSRNDVISEANSYRTCNWVVNGRNIQDIIKYESQLISGTTIYTWVRYDNESDGIDDRIERDNAGNSRMDSIDANHNGILDPAEFLVMRSYWPFMVDDSVTGEAYAWGHADATTDFTAKLGNTTQNWIAGRKPDDPENVNVCVLGDVVDSIDRHYRKV